MSDTLVRAAIVTVLGLIALVAPACDRPAANNIASPVPTRQVVDDLGRTVTVPMKVTRVVSTAPSVTENVFAVGAGDRLVGVTTFCNYPEEAKSIAKIGDTMTPNMETIVALKPDIVFVSTASQIEAFTKTLEQNGIAVYVTDPKSLEDVFKDLLKLGEIFGTEQKADTVVTNLRQRVANAMAALAGKPRLKVFVQISKEPLFTIGKQSFLTEFLEQCNLMSVTSDIETAYPKLSKETARSLAFDALILSLSDDNAEPNEVFHNSPAVKNSFVYAFDADTLARPGPRLVDNMESIVTLVHRVF